MAKYLYQVELVRRVRCPEYGPFANRRVTKTKNFPFGNGMEFKIGDLARDLVMEYTVT